MASKAKTKRYTRYLVVELNIEVLADHDDYDIDEIIDYVATELDYDVKLTEGIELDNGKEIAVTIAGTEVQALLEHNPADG